MSVLPLAGGSVHLSDYSGLFVVPLNRPRTVSTATTVVPRAMQPGRARVAPTDRHKGGLQRYCSGCVRETEHVVSARDGRGSIPSIRWPDAERAAGTTICLSCGQWRAGSSQPRPPAWSSWPRSRVTTPSVAVAATSADTADDWASETAAENEGMPPKREPRRLRRSSARLTRALQ